MKEPFLPKKRSRKNPIAITSHNYIYPKGFEQHLVFIKLGENKEKIYYKGFFTLYEPYQEFYLNIVKKGRQVELLPKW